ncbi:ferrochelatase [Brucella abortus 01-4165]|uniref:Ferrochelatase n=5 Tax=Brucella TaxID=234 RepID=HEMH_BRUA2|nr:MULTISPECIES: ferrochelatase [Brucella]B2SCP3.1 RecName: Full=Ferrochelatase; AltName: Full=Heme synthase; AltName: Full=Protoheme ferro-lyase [Brucella abortus S19]P0A3D8.2 RecName: Full=Ferrochelatase; AltName: Full=Heme synthase; AltName: Full=Protoheme ferro-lyase [Brucella abortus bv. 1 str. 9-941]Q2YIS9.1 RecName: Full=Ferrochelatase; AltName: Full=Heme synthase; AltName: Full=Protoheme ferro-lyase [Brucella abortus 2308]ERM85071.1 ferrochelatase [Brucella abortus 82]ERT79889.1 ferroc
MSGTDKVRVNVSQTAQTPLHTSAKLPKVGVLLVNLGTPDGTSYGPMRRYLAEFLSDRRVIEWSRLIWYPILYGIVLNTRPRRSGRLYDRIWNHENNESPLRTYTRAQGEKLAKALSDQPNVVVDWAMRYGQPSIESITDRLLQQGCERIVIFPLYPQYSATTTATVNDKFFEALMKKRFMPAIRTVPSYEAEPVYIDALARSVEKHLATLSFKPEVILTSYHGIPKSYSDKGDPYRQQCLETTRLLRERLGLGEDEMRATFQSRFGPEEWLQPYTDETVKELAKNGVKLVAVLNPGFVADCLETVDEIGNEAAEEFLENGGENFSHIPCLNDSEEGMKVIETLVRRELLGWV